MNEHRILNVTKSLVEMPGLLSGSEDFGLDSDSINRTKARYFDSEAAETLVENDRSRLAIIGEDDGVIGLVAKRDRKLYYYVRFTTSRIPMSDQAVTQIELWRHRRVEEFFPSITRHVFFSVLLNRFPAVMSDSLHTVQGQQFWERMVAAAKGMGLTGQPPSEWSALKYGFEPTEDGRDGNEEAQAGRGRGQAAAGGRAGLAGAERG